MVTVGVLALQGGVVEHQRILEHLGVQVLAAKKTSDFEGIDALVIPGGESTTISKLLSIFELKSTIQSLISSGMPVLGTCAGLILLSNTVDSERGYFAELPVAVKRNAYGSQLASGEAVVTYDTGENQNAAFIRAPRIVEIGESKPIAWNGGEVVAVQYRNLIGASYHPELTGSTALHRKLIELAKAD